MSTQLSSSPVGPQRVLLKQQHKAPITASTQHSVESQNMDQSTPQLSNLTANHKWQKIIKQTQNQEQSTPFLLKQESLQSSNHPEQFNRQKLMMQQTAKNGRQLLLTKNYLEASKQLSKALMAFQFIVKNNVQTIQKQLIKSIMIQTVLPTYNNLALCYLKLKNYELVVSLINQVLAQDDANVKARYRRALAYKELKNPEHAIKDFQIVKKLDPQIQTDCNQKVKECKLLQVQLKKKRKLAAQKFISGYQSRDIKINQNNQSQISGIKDCDQIISQKSKAVNILQWIKEKCQQCSKMFSKLGPNTSQQKKGE